MSPPRKNKPEDKTYNDSVESGQIGTSAIRDVKSGTSAIRDVKSGTSAIGESKSEPLICQVCGRREEDRTRLGEACGAEHVDWVCGGILVATSPPSGANFEIPLPGQAMTLVIRDGRAEVIKRGSGVLGLETPDQILRMVESLQGEHARMAANLERWASIYKTQAG